MNSKIRINSPNIRYSEDFIEADYCYDHVFCELENDTLVTTPLKSLITFRTETKLPKLGLMLIGWGGNNGTTVTASILANKLNLVWSTKDDEIKSNYFGSITQSSTVFIGKNKNEEDIFLRLCDLIPMVNPNDIILDGWDISSLNLGDAMKKAKVLDINLQNLIYNDLSNFIPRKAIFDQDYIAKNQFFKADNIIEETSKWNQVNIIREDIKDFKNKNNLDKVILLWTANTERFSNLIEGIHDTQDNLIEAIKNNEKEISPSILYAVAAILENCSFINGSPQNTFVDGLIELAESNNVFIGGDDFKSGQTKLKSVIVDFLISAGIKPKSIVSYNHLGNNDGFNLSEPQQFKSKEVSKLSVIDDMINSNNILYSKSEKPDHVVVIKYVPFVGDSKRAMDEYLSELMLGGRNSLIIHNTCEDSLLAAPLILDLVLITELCQRVKFKINKQDSFFDVEKFDQVLNTDDNVNILNEELSEAEENTKISDQENFHSVIDEANQTEETDLQIEAINVDQEEIIEKDVKNDVENDENNNLKNTEEQIEQNDGIIIEEVDEKSTKEELNDNNESLNENLIENTADENIEIINTVVLNVENLEESNEVEIEENNENKIEENNEDKIEENNEDKIEESKEANIKTSQISNKDEDFQSFNSVLSILSYLLKSPRVEKNATVINSLYKQKSCIENILRALIALPPINHMELKFKLKDISKWDQKQADSVL